MDESETWETTKKLLGTTDAQVWAQEFMRIWSGRLDEVDEGLMIGWFANAIETGRSAGMKASGRIDITGSIDPTDPLLEHFALQHDLRERFAHALEEILSLNLDAIRCTHDDAAEQMVEIAHDALDEDKLREWNEMGRPLPWMDEAINPLATMIRDQVLKQLGVTE